MPDPSFEDRLRTQWRERERFVVLDAGAGAVGRFLAAWNAWRHDPAACSRLHFMAIEPEGLTAADVSKLSTGSRVEALVAQLADVWPPMTPNWHRLSFEDGRVQLLLAVGGVSAVLPDLVCAVDAFRLSGLPAIRRDLASVAAGPGLHPGYETTMQGGITSMTGGPGMHSCHESGAFRSPGATRVGATSMTTSFPGSHLAHARQQGLRILRALSRIATANAALTIDGDSPEWRRAAAATGFEAPPAERTTHAASTFVFAPTFVPRRAPSRSGASPTVERHALIIGAGLAGSACAWALAEQGWRTTVLDRHASPAQEASGNPAGLFHGIVNPQDGAHARFNRAAALEAQRLVSRAVREWRVEGAVQGVLRLDDAPGGIAEMRAVLARSGLPEDYVRAVDTAQASSLAGIALGRPAWFYPGGGWVSPSRLADAMLASAGNQSSFHGGVDVHSLRRVDGRWMAFDADGRCVAHACVVVLANAGDALRLLGPDTWPIEPVRGQLSIGDSSLVGTLPRIPVAGAGYLLPEITGRAVFGATAQPGEFDMALRDEDHSHNLGQLRRLTGRETESTVAALEGRVGIRWSTDDRLPIIGAVPDLEAAKTASRLDQPRFVPRLPGAFAFTALGSRGITWCALGAQVLASSITGAPSPLEASLLDVIDAGRFVSRRARRDTHP